MTGTITAVKISPAEPLQAALGGAQASCMPRTALDIRTGDTIGCDTVADTSYGPGGWVRIHVVAPTGRYYTISCNPREVI